MQFRSIMAFGAAFLIGILLGLIGGGGSILTVPVLVYVQHISPVEATAYSLFIVGISSLFGSYSYFRKNQLDGKLVVLFGVPSILSVFLTRMYVLPLIPQEFALWNHYIITKDMALMVLFAILMILASGSMIRSSNDEASTATGKGRLSWKSSGIILTEGLVVGGLTGLVGAGGGFLIIPALLMVSNLNMKTAIGTSLLIIAAKSLIGFMGDLPHLVVDWTFLLSFSVLAIIGIFFGSMLSGRLSGILLKKAFGWFVLLMGTGILVKEIWFN